MKGKKVVSTWLVATLILSMAMLAADVSAPPLPVIIVEPQKVERTSAVYCTYNGTKFIVEVKIYNVTGLYGWDLWVSYDPTLLYVPPPVPPPFPSPVNVTGPGQVVSAIAAHYIFDWSKSIAGTVKIAVAFQKAAGAVPFNGNGTMNWIQFEIIKCPTQLLWFDNMLNCTLNVVDAQTFIYDNLGFPLAMQVPNDGWYSTTTEGIIPGAPTCIVSAPSSAYVSDNVLCDGTASTPGAGAVIQTWDWSLTGPGTWITPNNASTRTFHCDGVGTVVVTLNITNTPFFLSDDDNATIDQSEKLGCILDLFSEGERDYPPGTITPVTGRGAPPNKPCDAYAPGENVTVYVEVTYNGAPVNNILVGFEARGPGPTTWAFATDLTNDTGIATMSFTIPVPDLNPWLFGHWIVIATARICGVVQNDTLPFNVGWIVEIVSLYTTYDGVAETTFYQCDQKMDVGVVLKNIASIPKPVYVVVTVYDECGVPIETFTLYWASLPEGAYCHPESTAVYMAWLEVPCWAFVGKGKVCANVFTDYPRNFGIPYCPEKCVDITIKQTPPGRP